MNFFKNFCILLIFIILSGIVTGKIAGDYILSSALRGNNSFLTYIFSPSQSFAGTYKLLNDSSDYNRLTGYYAYNESGLIDIDFLYERYTMEDSDIIKKVIIWIAEQNNKHENLVDFYRKLYNISPDNIKKILLEKIEK